MLSQVITAKLKDSLQLNESLHICRLTIITEESILVIGKHHTKQLKLENHFILITDKEMRHIATVPFNCLLITCLPGLPVLSCTNTSLTSARIQYPTAAWVNYNVQFYILAGSDSTSVQMYDTLTCGCNSRQAYTPYTSARQALRCH